MITQILSKQLIYKMSLLKWKEMAEKRSKVGQNVKVPLTPKCFLNRNKTLFGFDYFGEKIIFAIGLLLDFL